MIIRREVLAVATACLLLSPRARAAGGLISGLAPSGLKINATFDSSTSGAPAGFFTGVAAAVATLQNLISVPVTITIAVGWGEENGNTLPGNVLGQSEPVDIEAFPYSQVKAAIGVNAKTANAIAAFNSLPAGDPTSGIGIYLTTAQKRCLGFLTSAPATDGYVGFATGQPFNYSGPTDGSHYDFQGVCLHEMTEIMGRYLFATAPFGYIMDLLRWSAPGVRQFGSPQTTATYFSVDSGTTAGFNFNNTASGDPGDWANASTPADSCNNQAAAGPAPFSTNDQIVMDAMGWSTFH